MSRHFGIIIGLVFHALGLTFHFSQWPSFTIFLKSEKYGICINLGGEIVVFCVSQRGKAFQSWGLRKTRAPWLWGSCTDLVMLGLSYGALLTQSGIYGFMARKANGRASCLLVSLWVKVARLSISWRQNLGATCLPAGSSLLNQSCLYFISSIKWSEELGFWIWWGHLEHVLTCGFEFTSKQQCPNVLGMWWNSKSPQ